MKAFSILFILLAVIIIAGSIVKGEWHCLPFAGLSVLAAWGTLPRRKEGRPYRTYRTWEDTLKEE